MRSFRRVLLFLGPVLLSAFTGCGFGNSTGACSAGDLIATTNNDATFKLATLAADFTIYPGQTEQIAVDVLPIGNAQGTVTLGGSGLPPGVSIAPTTAAIGSTATLTITATPNVVPECFTAHQGVFTAARAITILASSGKGLVTTQLAMNVELENPAFQPASTDLPVMRITTTDAAPVDSEDTYVDAAVTITDPTKKSNDYTGTTGIKGHGNSTWLMPKKPYRLNLDSKASLLGMTSSSNWILLANYDDKSMLRNDLSFELSTIFGMFWTPHTAFVELYLNNEYEGTYELSEKVEVSKARLNIGSIDDTDNSGEDLTGGYLGEIDTYRGATYNFTSQSGLPISLDDPDPPTPTQQDYFTSAFTAAEASMYNSNFTDPNTGWQASWDKDSLVNYYLIEELAQNQDAADFSSDYFYKPRSDAKFYRGPVWDMDITFGNDNYGPQGDPNTAWVIINARWYQQLFKDPAMWAAAKARWTELRPQVTTLPAYIDARAATLSHAAQNNNGRWPTFGETVWPNTEAAGSYQGEIDFLKSWLAQRIAFMDKFFLN